MVSVWLKYCLYTTSIIYIHAYIAILANAFVMEVLGVGAVKISFQRNHQIEENGHVTYVNFGVKWLGCNKKALQQPQWINQWNFITTYNTV